MFRNTPQTCGGDEWYPLSSYKKKPDPSLHSGWRTNCILSMARAGLLQCATMVFVVSNLRRKIFQSLRSIEMTSYGTNEGAWMEGHD